MNAAEFIEWECSQPYKHEFLAGEVAALAGKCRREVTTAGNCAAELRNHLRGGPCRAFMADMKVEVKTAEAVFYPDVLVTCHPDDLKADLAMANPKVIIEVLSESTAAHDRGEKFAIYRQLESLVEYVLIDPDTRRVDIFRRMDGGDWLLAASEAGQGLILKSLDFHMELASLFEDV